MLKLDSGDQCMARKGEEGKALSFALEAEQWEPEVSDDFEVRTRIHLNKAIALNQLNHPQEANEEFREALQFILKQEKGKYSIIYLVNLGRIAGNEMGLGQQDQARQTLEEAIRVSEEIGDDLFIASAYNNLGLYYERLQNPELADGYYKTALSKFFPDNEDDSLLRVSILDNQSNLLLARGQIDSAINIVAANFELLRTKPNLTKRTAASGLKLLRLYAETGQTDRMPPLFALVEPMLDQDVDRDFYRDQAEFQKHWIEYASLINNDALVHRHYRMLDSVRQEEIKWAQSNEQSYEKVISEHSMSIIQAELTERSARLMETERESRFIRIMSLALISFLVFVVISGILFYRRKSAFEAIQRRLRQSEIERQNLLNEQLKKDLTHKDKDFSDLLMRLTLKDGWVNDITEKLSNLIREYDTVEAAKIRTLIRELKQQGSLHEKLDLYQSGIEDVNARFFSTLEESFPTLTKSEKEICGLIRMNLNGKEIATIRNVDPASVRKMRQRIRKKIALTPDQDLYAFMQKV